MDGATYNNWLKKNKKHMGVCDNGIIYNLYSFYICNDSVPFSFDLFQWFG